MLIDNNKMKTKLKFSWLTTIKHYSKAKRMKHLGEKKAN